MESTRKEWYNMDFIEASGLSFSQLNETIRHAGKDAVSVPARASGSSPPV